MMFAKFRYKETLEKNGPAFCYMGGAMWQASKSI